MAHVRVMIEYKNMYRLDDIVLAQFCPNTFKLGSIEKYRQFSKQLHTFHNDSLIYESSGTLYTAFIINSVLLNSIELNKNILSYENYFFNVLTGFSEATTKKITTANIARAWANLLEVYNQILRLTLHENVKEVKTLLKVHECTRFINCDKINNNYYWEIPIQILYIDGTIRNLLIIPFQENTSILSNSAVLNTLNSFPSHNLTIIKIHLNAFKIEFMNLGLNSTILKFASDYIDKNYVSFSSANLHNCIICPLVSCTTEQMFKVVQPSLKKKLTKIKVLSQ